MTFSKIARHCFMTRTNREWYTILTEEYKRKNSAEYIFTYLDKFDQIIAYKLGDYMGKPIY